MANASLNITVVEKRMLRQSEAASYAGIAAKHFKLTCPVSPVEIRPGEPRWDKRDLDLWIEGLKEGAEDQSRESFLGRL